MKTIEIDDAVYDALSRHVRGFNESPNDVLKRLLAQISAEPPRDARPAKSKTIKKQRSSSPPSPPQSPPVQKEPDTEKDLRKLIISEAFLKLDSTGRYLRLLKCLHDYSPETFERLISYRFNNGKQVHIARASDEIEQDGSQRRARRIEGTQYFALVNLDNKRKREFLGDVLPGFGIPSRQVLPVLQTLADVERQVPAVAACS